MKLEEQVQRAMAQMMQGVKSLHVTMYGHQYMPYEDDDETIVCLGCCERELLRDLARIRSLIGDCQGNDVESEN